MLKKLKVILLLLFCLEFGQYLCQRERFNPDGRQIQHEKQQQEKFLTDKLKELEEIKEKQTEKINVMEIYLTNQSHILSTLRRDLDVESTVMQEKLDDQTREMQEMLDNHLREMQDTLDKQARDIQLKLDEHLTEMQENLFKNSREMRERLNDESREIQLLKDDLQTGLDKTEILSQEIKAVIAEMTSTTTTKKPKPKKVPTTTTRLPEIENAIVLVHKELGEESKEIEDIYPDLENAEFY